MLDACEWEYLAQGGRHVVFRYKGDRPEWVDNVVRFLKAVDGVGAEEDRIEVLETIEWLKREMVGEVGECMDVPVPVDVLHGEEKGFSELCGVELAAAADTMPDYTKCDILVELKPKKGVIFTTEAWCDKQEHIPSGDTLRKKCCKHCMQQSLKLGKGKISKVSKYCPVNLFQGDAEKELRHMFDVPQNSLTVRVGGELVDPAATVGEARDAVVKKTLVGLRKSKVLERLLRLQRRIPLDIESIHRARQRKSTHISFVPSEVGTCHAATLRSQSTDLTPGYEEPKEYPTLDTSTVSLSKAVESYFISRSAQDCSVMVQLYEDRSPRCRIIDLDKKPYRKYDFWYAQDRNLVSAFRESVTKQALRSESNPLPEVRAPAQQGVVERKEV
eukprot:TRINITY_DN2938_c0_g3_i2.p1 TRINITY_DN2938_c0_g3~~TRINITY_DN2938_c0_g3_i2.p1  ORF type:complete len:387 (+),score=118.48 TRINITY_DN2938_c0_g3_i2:368-1528(+)